MSDQPRPFSLGANEQEATGHSASSHTQELLINLCTKELAKFTDLHQDVKDKTKTTVQQVVEMHKISPASDSSGVNSNFLTLPGTKDGISPGKGIKGTLHPSPCSSGFAEMRPTADGTPIRNVASPEADTSLETPDEERNEMTRLAQATLTFVEGSLLKAASPEEAMNLMDEFIKRMEEEFEEVKNEVVAGVSEFVTRARKRKYTIWTTLKLFVPCL